MRGYDFFIKKLKSFVYKSINFVNIITKFRIKPEKIAGLKNALKTMTVFLKIQFLKMYKISVQKIA